MWRFPVEFGSPRVLSRISHTLFLNRLKHNGSFSKDFLQLSHTDFKPLQDHRREYVLASINGEVPVREVTSFDDFGLLSIQRSNSNETVSSMESSFLDHILRSDVLTQYSAGVRIPTTVDSCELGGTNEFAGLEQAVEMIAEGMDANAVVEELLDNSDMQAKQAYYDEQQPSTSKAEASDVESDLPYLIPTTMSRSSRTRQVLTEKMRKQRKNNISLMSTVAERGETIEMTNIGEMMFGETSPHDVALATSSASAPIKEETVEVVRDCSLEELEELVAQDKMEEFRKLLEDVAWPQGAFDSRHELRRANAILRFAVEKSKDSDDGLHFLSQFAASDMRACVSDDVLLLLCARVAQERDVLATCEAVVQMSRLCLTRQTKVNRSLVLSSLSQLYDTVLNKGTINDCESVLESCLRSGFDKSADIFLQSAMKHAKGKDVSFDVAFGCWRRMSAARGSTSGVESLWNMAITKRAGDKKGAAGKRVEQLLTFCQSSEHPFASVAHLLCAHIRADRLVEAQVLFTKVSVSGRFFIKPLSIMVAENDLGSIERLATLMTKCMFAERKRGPRSKGKVDETVEAQVDEYVVKTLDKFCGVGNRKPKFVPFNAKQKRKMHRVDETQLHELTDAVVDAWLTVAQKQVDSDSARRLLDWCAMNRVDVDEKIVNEAKKLSEKQLC